MEHTPLQLKQDEALQGLVQFYREEKGKERTLMEHTPLQKKIEELVEKSVHRSGFMIEQHTCKDVMQELATWVVQTVMPVTHDELSGGEKGALRYMSSDEAWDAQRDSVKRRALSAGIPLE